MEKFNVKAKFSYISIFNYLLMHTPFSSFAMASEVIESEANFLNEYHDAMSNFLVSLLLYISFVISFNNSTALQ